MELSKKNRKDVMIYVCGQYFLNHELQPGLIRKQVREIAKCGYQEIYAHPRQGLMTPYFSEKWWQILGIILEECQRTGMKLSIWDEDYYPSPTAGNRIAWNRPELLAQSLLFTTEEFKASQKTIRLDLAAEKLLRCYAMPILSPGIYGKVIDITAHCGTIRTQWANRAVREEGYGTGIKKIPMPHWRASMPFSDRRFVLDWNPQTVDDYLIVAIQAKRADTKLSNHHTDILNPETSDEFLKLTHEQYVQRFGSKNFYSCFLDEPATSGLFPWTDRFASEFQQEHDYDLLDNLVHLAVNVDEHTPQVRFHYRATQMRLSCESYLEKIQMWGQQHNILSIGHLHRSEAYSLAAVQWPNQLRCYKYLDIPCTDPLGAGIAWSDAAAYHAGLKVVSSAAYLFNKSQCGSDALAVMGNETSLRDLKFVVDYSLILGINYFCLHGLSYSFDGPRKDEVPQPLFYQHSQWQYMPKFISYIKTMCEQFTAGKTLCEIGVVYPSSSFFCSFDASQNFDLELEEQNHVLLELMLSNQKDFFFIDEITLTEKIPIKWTHVILPYMTFISESAAMALDAFIIRGGKVAVIGQIPALITDNPKCPRKEWQNPDLTLYEDSARLIASLPGPELSGLGKENIFVQRRLIDGEIRSFLFNRAEDEFVGVYERIPTTVCAKSLSVVGQEYQVHAELVEELGGADWTIRFPDNHVPLGIWRAKLNGEDLPYDLLQRQSNPLAEETGPVTYESRFMYTGEPRKLKIVFDRSALSGDWILYFNDTEIKEFKEEQVYDCFNFSVDISAHLRSGSTPMVNVVKIVCYGQFQGLYEVAHLYGEFLCEYRHAHRSLPFLSGHDGEFQTNPTRSWSQLGYPAFSGTAEYGRDFEVDSEAEYHLDLGRIDDLAEVYIDGRKIATLPWEPYRCSLGLIKKGQHNLRIKIANGPGNHDFLAMLNAGMRDIPKLYCQS